MKDEIEPTEIISLSAATLEFTNAYGPIIGMLVLDKLTLIRKNEVLRSRIAELEDKLFSIKSGSQDKPV